MTKENPSYYSILPADVRYCANLEPNAKILYSELSALSNAEGYAWASNKYFARLYGFHTRTVTRLISSLEKEGFIKVYVTRVKEGYDRKVFILNKTHVAEPEEAPKKKVAKKESKPKTKKVADELKENGVAVLAHWNSKQTLPKHRDNYLERGVSGKATYLTLLKRLLQDYTLEEIKNTVNVYDDITSDTSYWWSHKWTLCDFLKRGYDRFKDEQIAKANFYKNGKKKDTYVPDFSEGF